MRDRCWPEVKRVVFRLSLFRVLFPVVFQRGCFFVRFALSVVVNLYNDTPVA